MKIIINISMAMTPFFFFARVHAQSKPAGQSLYGNWKCVKHDYRGTQKFSQRQAEKIRTATLVMERTTFYYTNIGFIKPCRFSGWKISKYDTSAYTNLELVYNEKELAGVYTVEPVDAKGEFACFNDCSLFYLKQDTLINNCGGYTFYLVRSKDKK